jgi:hypothetical protein
MIICSWCYVGLGYPKIWDALGYGPDIGVRSALPPRPPVLLTARAGVAARDAAARVPARLHPRGRHRSRARVHGRVAPLERRARRDERRGAGPRVLPAHLEAPRRGPTRPRWPRRSLTVFAGLCELVRPRREAEPPAVLQRRPAGLVRVLLRSARTRILTGAQPVVHAHPPAPHHAVHGRPRLGAPPGLHRPLGRARRRGAHGRGGRARRVRWVSAPPFPLVMTPCRGQMTLRRLFALGSGVIYVRLWALVRAPATDISCLGIRPDRSLTSSRRLQDASEWMPARVLGVLGVW